MHSETLSITLHIIQCPQVHKHASWVYIYAESQKFNTYTWSRTAEASTNVIFLSEQSTNDSKAENTSMKNQSTSLIQNVT